MLATANRVLLKMAQRAEVMGAVVVLAIVFMFIVPLGKNSISNAGRVKPRLVTSPLRVWRIRCTNSVTTRLPCNRVGNCSR